jgi:hypothetical protein
MYHSLLLSRVSELDPPNPYYLSALHLEADEPTSSTVPDLPSNTSKPA